MTPGAWWGCARKRTYSEKTARKAAANQTRKYRKTFSAYVCTYCTHWHLTTRGVTR